MKRDEFARFCVIFIAAEWIIFGSMHFSMVEATVAQVPRWLPWREQLAIITGMLEVATGVLILVPELRRKVAIASVVLLVLLLPAVYNILASPDALRALQPSWTQTLFRLILVPNNIFLGICSVHLWRYPDLPAEAAGEPMLRRRARPALAEAMRNPVALIVPALLLIANMAGFLAIIVGAPGQSGTASMWAMSCIAVGALIGFLFGVPRVNPGTRIKAHLVPNTNVEAVSDWLTKILVGVGLINFREIGAFVAQLADMLSKGTGTSAAFATSLIVYFFVTGIIQGYILTRIFLAAQFQAAEDAA